jgi:hypothetical protein
MVGLATLTGSSRLIPWLCWPHPDGFLQVNEFILVGLATLMGSSRFILVGLATLTGSSRLILEVGWVTRRNWFLQVNPVWAG